MKTGKTIDNKYSKWLGSQPCLITGKKAKRGTYPNNMHCHHVRGRKHGLQNDYIQVPLIGDVHNYYHNKGATEFIKKYSLVCNIIISDDIKQNHRSLIAWFEEHASKYYNKYTKMEKTK